jgi:branched-chain amino acid transport system substrate-binding protein
MLSRRRFLLGVPLLALAGCSRRAAEEPLPVGHVGPFSGSERLVGEHTQRGIRLALSDVNTDDVRPLVVIHADSRSQGDRARSEAVRLVSVNRVAVLLGGTDQASADRLAQALQPYPTPLLTAAPHSSVGLENTFSLDVTAEFRGTSLAKFAAEQFKARRAVLLVDETSALCSGVGTAFARQWRAGKGVAHNWDPRAEESASRLVERLKKTEAEVVLFAGLASDFLRVRGLILDGKLQPKLLFGGEPSEWQQLEGNSDVTGDVFGATVHATSRFDEAGKKFVKNYREKYQEDPDASACQGYELIGVLAPALREAKGSPSRLREELAEDKKEWPGLTGAFLFNQAHAARPLYMVRVRDPIPLETFKPGE